MDVTPIVILIAVLVVAGAALVLFVPVAEPMGAPAEEESSLIQQPYGAGRTIEQPTPYFTAPVPESPDPLEVSANLDKKAILSVAMVFGLLVMTGAYFAITPTLRANAAMGQLETDAARGANLYASLCFDCHGQRGQGLVGLPLDKPSFKATCDPNGQPFQTDLPCKPGDDAKARDLIQKTVSRGRPRPAPAISMPAWSQSDGGPLNDAQIGQLVTFVMYGNWDLPLQIREEQGLELEPHPPVASTAGQSPEEVGKSIAQTTCITCHSFTPGTASTLPQAPNLGHYATEGPFADQLKALKAKDPDWLTKWVTNAPAIKPGTLMPKWEGTLTADQINDVVAYLKSLK